MRTLSFLLILSVLTLHNGIASSEQDDPSLLPPDSPDVMPPDDPEDAPPDTLKSLTIPEDLHARLLDHASTHSDPSTGEPGSFASFGEEDFIQRLKDGEQAALYMVADSMNEVGNKKDAVLTWHELADDLEAKHIESKYKLGFYYEKEENDKEKAVKYFTDAGVWGFHQDALYHAGRVYADLEQYDMALAHMRASIDNEPKPVPKGHKMTDVVKKEYTSLSDELRKKMDAQELTPIQMVDIFKFSNLDYYPENGSPEDDIWFKCFDAVHHYNEKKDSTQLETARENLMKVLDFEFLSILQFSVVENVLKYLDNIKSQSPEL